MAILSTLSSLIFLQLSSRLLTFALNQSLVRLTTPKAYGTASIQFELLSSTILFVGREGVRNALLRSTNNNNNKDGGLIVWLPLILGFPTAIITLGLYLGYAAGEEVVAQSLFYPALSIYIFAALVELATEPGHNYCMTHDKTTLRVRAEGLGVTLKTITTFIILVYSSSLSKDDDGHGDIALMAYAIGQLVYSLTLVGIYLTGLGFTPWSSLSLPASTAGGGVGPTTTTENSLLRLALTMTSHSIVKHFLTEGDRLILSLFAKLEDQGGYALAVNYGSLIARIVFQPIEETLRVFFSRILPAVGSRTHNKGTDTDKSVRVAYTTLTDLLRLQVTFSLFFLIFGNAYLGSVLNILLPERYLQTSAPQILKGYVYYIPFLSINGSLEAFVSSASSSSDLNKQSSYMIMFSLIYIISAFTFYSFQWGDSSLIYANIVNLSVRIFYALQFCRNYFSSSSSSSSWSLYLPKIWSSLFPSPLVIIQSTISLVILTFLLPGTFLSSSSSYSSSFDDNILPLITLRELARNLGFGFILGVGCVGFWWIGEGRGVVVRMMNVGGGGRGGVTKSKEE